MKPTTQPIGVGDLKVIKTRLARYDAGDVAHVENILASEKRERLHRRLHQVEEILTVEQDREEESRRDLQSTERFELQAEIQRTVKSDTRLEAGLELSASYGPVRLGAYARFSSNDSKEESDKTATKYAKEITDKAMTRLVEKVRQERRTRTLEEVEETNSHGFDNTDGANIAGVYRWVDKFYRAKVVNYGRRLLYEFIVPEPAAYLVWASKRRSQSAALPRMPAAPTVPGTGTPLLPNHIDRSNYLAIVQQTGAEGVEPPPPATVVISKALSREFKLSEPWTFANEDLDVPNGYKATSGAYRTTYLSFSPPKSLGAIVIGRNLVWDVINPANLLMDGETGNVGIAGSGYNISALAFTVEIECSLIAEHFQRWQLATYQAAMTAYRKALANYEEAVAAAQIQGGVRVGGTNPVLNRETERDELQRLCLVMWTSEALNFWAGYRSQQDGMPVLERANIAANGTHIEFFQEAFEWQNLTYELYPSFWGRPEGNEARLALDSEDPLFERFLQAGAARVVVPVVPSRAESVLWYQLTGLIWSGGSIPPLTDTGLPEADLYNGYLADLGEVADTDDAGIETEILTEDDSTWLLRVPTNLVWLQADGELPDFEKA